MTDTKATIPAKAHTDDYVFKVDFDAASWFERATDDEILALAACRWSAGYPVDKFAVDSAERPVLGNLVRYLGSTGKNCEFECRVDSEAAMEWLREHRPKVAGKIEARPLFLPGTVVATVGATMLASQFELKQLLNRHLRGDWGDVDSEDAKANYRAVKHGERILSAYEVKGDRLWVETTSDRSVTTIMLPGDY